MFVLFEIVIFKAQECISSLDFFLFFALLQEIACNKDYNYMRVKCGQ